MVWSALEGFLTIATPRVINQVGLDIPIIHDTHELLPLALHDTVCERFVSCFDVANFRIHLCDIM